MKQIKSPARRDDGLKEEKRKRDVERQKKRRKKSFCQEREKYGEKRTARTHAADAAQTMAATPSSEINYGVRLPRVAGSKILKM